MITRKMMALAAIPVAAVLAGGGVAVAQAAGTPAGPAVVQQVAVHHSGNPWHGHQAAPVTARHDGDRRTCGDHGTCGRDHADHGQAVRADSGVTARAHCHDGHSGDDHGDE
jgi:hypothetical protein